MDSSHSYLFLFFFFSFWALRFFTDIPNSLQQKEYRDDILHHRISYTIKMSLVSKQSRLRNSQCFNCFKEWGTHVTLTEFWFNKSLRTYVLATRSNTSQMVSSQYNSPVMTLLATRISDKEPERWMDMFQATRSVYGKGRHLASPDCFLSSIQSPLDNSEKALPAFPSVSISELSRVQTWQERCLLRMGASSYSQCCPVGQVDLARLSLHSCLPVLSQEWRTLPLRCSFKIFNKSA